MFLGVVVSLSPKVRYVVLSPASKRTAWLYWMASNDRQTTAKGSLEWTQAVTLVKPRNAYHPSVMTLLRYVGTYMTMSACMVTVTQTKSNQINLNYAKHANVAKHNFDRSS